MIQTYVFSVQCARKIVRKRFIIMYTRPTVKNLKRGDWCFAVWAINLVTCWRKGKWRRSYSNRAYCFCRRDHGSLSISALSSCENNRFLWRYCNGDCEVVLISKPRLLKTQIANAWFWEDYGFLANGTVLLLERLKIFSQKELRLKWPIILQPTKTVLLNWDGIRSLADILSERPPSGHIEMTHVDYDLSR